MSNLPSVQKKMVFVWHPITIFKCARGNIIEQQNVEVLSFEDLYRGTVILNRISNMSNFHGNVGMNLK